MFKAITYISQATGVGVTRVSGRHLESYVAFVIGQDSLLGYIDRQYYSPFNPITELLQHPRLCKNLPTGTSASVTDAGEDGSSMRYASTERAQTAPSTKASTPASPSPFSPETRNSSPVSSDGLTSDNPLDIAIALLSTAAPPICQCPVCGHPGAERRRQNTAYADDERNFVTLCPSCHEENNKQWGEQWSEYYGAVAL